MGGGGAASPDTYAADVATWNLAGVTCSPADGTVTVTVDATDAIGNTAVQDSDDITSDNILPTAVTSFDMEPDHEKLVMSWDDPSATDTNFYGLVVRYDDWESSGMPAKTIGTECSDVKQPAKGIGEIDELMIWILTRLLWFENRGIY